MGGESGVPFGNILIVLKKLLLMNFLRKIVDI